MADKGKRFPRGDLPRGFAFTGNSVEDLMASPGDPHLYLPRGVPELDTGEKFKSILLQGIPISAGSFFKVIGDLYDCLEDEGDLYFRIPNECSWGRVQNLISGRVPTFQSPGTPWNPLITVTRENLALGLWNSGLVTHEIVASPSMMGGASEEVLKGLWEQDVDTASLDGEGRIESYFVHARREEPFSGSVIIAAESAVKARETEHYVRSILPPNWQVICSFPEEGEKNPGEPELWNRGFVASRGDRIWFLRAGQRPPATWLTGVLRYLFDQKKMVVTANEEDLAGLLIHRRDYMALGPLPWYRTTSQVVREEFLLRATRKGRRVHIAAESIHGPRGNQKGLAEEAKEFVGEYSFLNQKSKPTSTMYDRAETPWGDREPTISLCMIAKNEEEFLANCLASVHEKMDEIILIDTGSTDRTIEIARSFGAQVFESEWQNDFSQARNLSLKEATCDWILVLDADEVVSPEALENIMAGIKDPTVLCYHLHFRNVVDGDHLTTGVRMTRLFRNLDGIAYERPIHEQVVHSLLRAADGMNLRLAWIDGEIYHHGYTKQVMEGKEKKERNWKIFEKHIEDDPDDVYNWYKFGDFMRRYGTPDEVRNKLGRALELLLAMPDSKLTEAPYAAEVATLLALEEALGGDQKLASDLLDTAMDRFCVTPNTLFIAAGIAVRANRLRLALQLYDQCLGFKGMVLVVPIEEGLVDYASWHAMGTAWATMGFRQRGQEYIEAALAENPDHLPAMFSLVSLFLGQESPGEALDVLTWYLSRNPDCSTAWAQGAGILLRLGLPEQAQRWANKANTEGDGLQDGGKINGEIAFVSGRFAEARVAWQKLEPDHLRNTAEWLLDTVESNQVVIPAIHPETRGWVTSLTRLISGYGDQASAGKIEHALANMETKLEEVGA